MKASQKKQSFNTVTLYINTADELSDLKALADWRLGISWVDDILSKLQNALAHTEIR